MNSVLHHPASTDVVQRFLDRVDQVGASLHLNVPPVIDLTTLQSLPVGTLGHALVQFFATVPFRPLTTGPRRKQLHDVVHVLTGYGTDPIGEIEVQAFLLGCKFHPIHLVLGLGLLRILIRQSSILTLGQAAPRQRLWAAYWRGYHSTFDIDTWQPETAWHLPLIQIQDHYGITA
jgi:ubiquinone biosynthesis protein Coq4